MGHFAARLPQLLPRLRWLHFECRELPSVAEMAAVAASAGSGRSFTLSVEVEKPTLSLAALRPLLSVADVTFFSREFVEKRAAEVLPAGALPTPSAAADPPTDGHPALRFLRALSATVQPSGALWIVGWGSLGAFGLHTPSGKGIFEPAVSISCVVESVGAG